MFLVYGVHPTWAHVDDNGVIIFFGNAAYGCSSNCFLKILTSDDHGTTWQVVKDYGSNPSGGSSGAVGLPSYYATNWSGLYGGLGSGNGVPPLRGIIGRVLPANSTFYVDATNGVDWTNFGITQARPVKTLNYLEMLDIQPGDTVQFIGSNTYTNPLIAGWSGNGTSNISLRGNTTSTFSGGNLANTPAVAETFESAKGSWNFTLNEAGGSITADTSIVHEGAQSAKIVRGASGTTSMSLKNVASTNINEGDTMYVSYWFYYPTDQTSGSDPTMLRILDNSSYELRTELRYSSASFLQNEIVLNAPQTSNWTIPSRKSLTSGNWHKMYIEDYLHSTNGSFKMYVDNQLWLNVNGIKTVTAGGKMNAVWFYPYLNPITFYVDDFKFGKLPFDNRGAINTNDYNYLDFGNFKFGGNNGALISSNSNNINLHDSIFNSLTNDAIISSGSANLNFYYNTIFGSGRYGFNTATSATLKNNVVYNSTTNDVFIGAGATLTGNNNWFKDSAKSGTGTYTDAGNTTWSGASPAFVNSGTEDFHLLSTSPLINAGTTVTGFTSDFASTTRPQGTAPDIGAYEFILPDSPTTLAQYRSDGTTTISSGAYINESTVVLKFNMSSTNSSDSLTPQVEIQPIGTSFTNTVTNSGSAVAYSETAVSGTVTITGLTTGTTYHWQARVNNAAGGGSWVYMGGNPDYGIDTTAPTNPSLSSPTGYTKDNTKPTLVFKKSTDSSSYISSYTVSLDSGKSRNFSTSGIPANGNGSSSYTWKDDSSVKIEFLNENDSDSLNDEIHVYFKDLDKQDLSEGKHTWTVTAYNPASNSTSKSADFYIDKTSPSISDLAVANVSTVQSGKTYTLSILNRTPSFSGLAIDSYQGSNVTNSDGSKDTFDNVSSGPQTITLTLKRQKDDKSWVDYLTQDYSLSNIQDTANDKKSTRFYITTPFPLIDGYYQSTIVLKDSAGNSYTEPVFYLSINNNLPWPLQNLFGGNLETKIIDSSTVPNNKRESNNACKTYTVKSGDSLWSISKILTGDGDKYKDIIEQNKDKYPSLANSNSITTGWVLQINCQPGQTPEDNQPLSQNGYDVKIKVVDTNKKPVLGAKVAIHSKVQETITNKDGIAEFQNVEPGNHKILITYSGYQGEQAINLTGDVKEFNFNIQIKPVNAFLNPMVMIAIGVMGLIILGLIVLLIKNKRKE